MGVEANITMDTFPQQGPFLGRMVDVCFHYDTSHRVLGRVVRDDVQDPMRTIIKLDDGRYVLASECQFSVVD